MPRTCASILLACLLALPAAGQERWLKGNLHTHTLWSDGNDFPEMVAAWYADRGYDFLALSDHNILSQCEKWMPLATIRRRGGEGALDRCAERFGPAHLETRGEGDSLEVRLKTLPEIRTLLQRPDAFILIQSEEITDSFEGHPVHLNATNVQELIEPQGGSSVPDVIRRNLIAVREQAERTGAPILGHVNHPNYGFAITAEDMAQVLEEHFFEVFNGHPSVHTFGDRTHMSVEQMWDVANTIRIRELESPPLYGIATDDSHNYHREVGSIPGRGWVMVCSKSLDASSIIGAMRRGDFYASTGVTLREVRFDEAAQTLTIEVDPAEDAEYVIRFIGTRTGPDAVTGEVLSEVHGTTATYRLAGDELYVRATVMSSRAVEFPVVEGQQRQAWTQPVGWR